MILFIELDSEFQQWVELHRYDGFIIGCDKWPAAGSGMRLHHANCPTASMMEAGMFSKACSTSQARLETWAHSEVGGSFSYCGRCFRDGQYEHEA